MFPDHLSVSYDYARAGSAIKGHLDNCSNVEHLFFIINFILNNVKTHECRLNLVRQNTRITDCQVTETFCYLKKHTILKRTLQF